MILFWAHCQYKLIINNGTITRRHAAIIAKQSDFSKKLMAQFPVHVMVFFSSHHLPFDRNDTTFQSAMMMLMIMTIIYRFKSCYSDSLGGSAKTTTHSIKLQIADITSQFRRWKITKRETHNALSSLALSWLLRLRLQQNHTLWSLCVCVCVFFNAVLFTFITILFVVAAQLMRLVVAVQSSSNHVIHDWFFVHLCRFSPIHRISHHWNQQQNIMNYLLFIFSKKKREKDTIKCLCKCNSLGNGIDKWTEEKEEIDAWFGKEKLNGKTRVQNATVMFLCADWFHFSWANPTVTFFLLHILYIFISFCSTFRLPSVLCLIHLIYYFHTIFSIVV